MTTQYATQAIEAAINAGLGDAIPFGFLSKVITLAIVALMVIFVIGNIPLMYMLNQDWYDVLMHTMLGQIILSITAAVIFISAGFVVKLTRPIEYRR